MDVVLRNVQIFEEDFNIEIFEILSNIHLKWSIGHF